MAAQHLPPLPQQIGVFDQCIARQTETLVIREKVMSLSGDSFEITLASGQPVLQIKGKAMTLSGRKSVYDMANTHLFDLVQEHLHIHSTYVAEDPKGKKFFEVKNKFAILGSKATATFTTPRTGKAESLLMKGNWLDQAEIVDESTGAVVARIDRKLLSGRDFLFDVQKYACIVAPGADMALLAAMCICLDEHQTSG